MRLHVAALGLAAIACGSRTTPLTAESEVSCPNRVVATVSNPGMYIYDVYYQGDGHGATVIGEISAGSTVSFPLPGEGRGRVFLRRPSADISTPNVSAGRSDLEPRIRIHCAA